MASARKIDINGFITIERNPISRAGVFPYLGANLPDADPDRIYNVYRPAEELADPEAIESFKMLPLVDEHTMIGSRYSVAPEQKGIHGALGQEVEFDHTSQILFSPLKIYSDIIKHELQAGKKQLSMGYQCVYEKKRGVHDGQEYDYIQRNIRGNHIALVEKGRMGPDIAVLDHNNDTVALDHFDLVLDKQETDMAEEENKVDQDTEEAEMTLSELCAIVKEIMPKIAEMNDAIAGMGKKETEGVDKNDEEGEDESEEEKKKEEAMDAAIEQIKSLQSRLDAVESRGSKQFMAEIANRDNLARQIQSVVGTFDHAEMTAEEVAAYGAEKLGLKVAKGQEQAAITGYLAAQRNDKIAFTMDAAPKEGGKLKSALASRTTH